MALNKINNFYNELIYIDSNIFLYALNKGMNSLMIVRNFF